jgi:hypothetical protein
MIGYWVMADREENGPYAHVVVFAWAGSSRGSPGMQKWTLARE